jgi:hypothetical protein
VKLVEEFIKGKEKSDNKTIGETVEGLKRKVGNSELFDTFLCCLLMSDPSKGNKALLRSDPSKGNKAYFFGGVFKVSCTS